MTKIYPGYEVPKLTNVPILFGEQSRFFKDPSYGAVWLWEEVCPTRNYRAYSVFRVVGGESLLVFRSQGPYNERFGCQEALAAFQREADPESLCRHARNHRQAKVAGRP